MFRRCAPALSLLFAIGVFCACPGGTEVDGGIDDGGGLDDAGVDKVDGGADDGGTSLDAGVDAGTDGGTGEGPCGPYAFESPFDGCTSTISWTAGPATPYRADHQASIATSFSTGPVLLFTGGARDAFAELFDGIARADIATDGSLSLWSTVGTLPEKRAGHTVEHVNGNLIVMSGSNGTTFLSSVKHATLDDNGVLGAWQTDSADMPGQFWHHQSVVRSSAIFVVGGQTFGGVSVDTAYRGRVLGSGVIDAWEPLPSLPSPRSHHGMAQTTTSLYVVGGLHDQDYEATVYRARFQGSGIAEWETLDPMPTPVVTPSVVVVGDGLFVVGGLGQSGPGFHGEIYRAQILDDDDLGPWVRVADDLPLARGHVHQIPTWNGHIYSLAGRTAASPPNYLSSDESWVGTVSGE